MLEDIVRDFTDMDERVAKFSPEQLIDDRFGHFEKSDLEPVYPAYECDCSRERTAAAIKLLGRAEAEKIVAEAGRIEVGCDFCGKKYVFDADDVRNIFDKDRNGKDS